MFILRKVSKKAAQHCIKEAAHSCKQHWNHPKELRKCGVRKNYNNTHTNVSIQIHFIFNEFL